MLTDEEIYKLPKKDKAYKVFDSHCLFLEIRPNKSKYRWCYKYTEDKKEHRVFFGHFPDMGVEKAREMRNAFYNIKNSKTAKTACMIMRQSIGKNIDIDDYTQELLTNIEDVKYTLRAVIEDMKISREHRA